MNTQRFAAASLRALGAGLALALLALPSQAHVDVNLNIGVPLAPAVVAPPPAMMVAPSMVWAPEYGAYVAVDSAQPLLYLGGMYYMFSAGVWVSGPHYWGPWVSVERMPRGLDRFHPRDWDHMRWQAREHMGDPRWRRFRPGPDDAPRRGYRHERGDDRGEMHGPGRERGRERY